MRTIRTVFQKAQTLKKQPWVVSKKHLNLKEEIEMKRKMTSLVILFALIAVSSALWGASASAQNRNGKPNDNVKTDSRILYHDGPVMAGTSNIYLIWYGNWNGNTAPGILVDFVSNLGGSPYFIINSTYPDSTGAAPGGGLIYGGSINDVYSHGTTLTESDVPGVVSDAITAGQLPLDPAGIYFVLASADVTDLRSDGTTTFCSLPSTPPLHGTSWFNGSPFAYAFIGNPDRCPTTAASQFVAPDGSLLAGPNGNMGADAMASTMAYVLNALVTNPTGAGWFDRYGLENAAKCLGVFGPTYLTPTTGRANMRLGARDFLIQQNWVNHPRKGYCGLSLQ